MSGITVTVIDVNLGVSVSDIIASQSKELSQETTQAVEAALESAKMVQDLKNQKTKEKNDQDEKVTTVMQKAYDRLKEAGEEGVPVVEIAEIINGVIATMPAFTNRMKTILAAEGNLYRIERSKGSNAPRYLLIPHNLPES
jgi:hypothetical protein